MSVVEKKLKSRSDSKCELCKSDDSLSVYGVPPVQKLDSNNCVLVCVNCLG